MHVCVTEDPEVFTRGSFDAGIITGGLQDHGGGRSPSLGAVLSALKTTKANLLVFVRPKIHALGESYPEATKQQAIAEAEFYTAGFDIRGVVVPGMILRDGATPGIITAPYGGGDPENTPDGQKAPDNKSEERAATGRVDIEFVKRLRAALPPKAELWASREISMLKNPESVITELAKNGVNGLILPLMGRYEESDWLMATINICRENKLKIFALPIGATSPTPAPTSSVFLKHFDGLCACKVDSASQLAGRLLEWRQWDCSCGHFGMQPQKI